nr:transmembrane protein 120 homolog [Ipomoea trifida]
MGDSTVEDLNYAEEVPSLGEQAKELQDAASALISRTARDEESLRKRAASLEAHIQSIRSSIGSRKLDSIQAEKVDACIR